MRTPLLTAVSALALVAAAPAFAETGSSDSKFKKDVERSWNQTKEDAAEVGKNISQAADKAYEDVRAVFIDDQSNAPVKDVVIDSRNTARHIIGKNVMNANNEKIAKVEDIILDSNGKAVLVVLSEGGFLGIDSKLAAFDYGSISGRDKDGNVIIPISEETMDKVAAFSYDTPKAGSNVRVMPNNGYSVAKLLGSEIIDPQQKKVAVVEDISLNNGEANQLVIAFDRVLGLGGKKAAMNFQSAQIVQDGDKHKFALNAAQTAQFENFKQSKAN